MQSLRMVVTAVMLFFIALPGCARPSHDPVSIPSVEIKNLKQDGDLYIAGAPTLQGLDDAKARGVTTIIDLRGPEEDRLNEAVAAQTKGFNYIRLPMPADQLTPDQANRFLDAMQAHDHEKVLIHCAGGNRAAAMYGLYLGTAGTCSTREAIERAKKAGLKSEKLSDQVRQEVERRQAGKK